MTVRQVENSEVSPPGSAAVDVTTSPWVTEDGNWTVNDTLFPTVLTEADPRNRCPSPWFDGSHAGLEKNNRRKVVLAVLFNVPVIVVIEGVDTADVTAGKFWNWLGPTSPSFVSLRVSPMHVPHPVKSMPILSLRPGVPLAKIEFASSA